jgi:hypothetical protein
VSTTHYAGAHAERRATSTIVGRKMSKKTKKVLLASSLVGVLVVPVAAWAAVELFGFGRLEAGAATTANLTVDNSTATLTAKLLPGTTVGAKANVTNSNDFPVTVTAVIVRNSTLAVVPNSAACQSSVHVVGTATTWPGAGGGAGTLQAVSENVTIPAGATRTVTVPQAVRQDASATVLCGVQADFAVRAQNAS